MHLNWLWTILHLFFFVYLSLEPTRYRSRKHRSRNYFPQWSEYKWSVSSVTLALPNQRQKAGFVLAGICQLSLDFHFFSFPSLSLLSSCTLVLSLIFPDCWRPVSVRAICCGFSIYTAWCLLPLVSFNDTKLHAISHSSQVLKAHDEQLLLYIRLTRDIRIASAQQQNPPFYIPYFVKHSVAFLRSALRNILTSVLSNYWSSSFPLHFQPGNVWFSTLLSLLPPVLLAGLFAFILPVN